MPNRPSLKHREPIRYVAIAGSGTGESEFRAFADRAFAAAFGAAGELGLTPTAAPFFRIFRFVLGGEFEVEVGVPVNGETTAPMDASTADAYVTELPAGRYAVHVHEGAYSADDETWADRDLASAHRHLESWAEDQGVSWATDDDGRLEASIEQYLVGPAESPDVASWRTLIAKLVKD